MARLSVFCRDLVFRVKMKDLLCWFIVDHLMHQGESMFASSLEQKETLPVGIDGRVFRCGAMGFCLP